MTVINVYISICVYINIYVESNHVKNVELITYGVLSIKPLEG